MKSFKRWAVGMGLGAVLLGSLVMSGCGGGNGNPVTSEVTSAASELDTADEAEGAENVQELLGTPLASGSGQNPAGYAGGESVGESFSASPAYARTVDLTLSGKGTAVIDGILSAEEWASSAHVDFGVKLPEGNTAPATLYVMNDAQNLYLAVKFVQAEADAGNSLVFEFDNNNNGVMENGDDALVHNPSTLRGLADIVRSNQPPCPSSGSLCGFLDIVYGGTNDGKGAFLNDGSYTVYELSHPLDSGDTGHDFSLKAGDTVGFYLMVRLIAAWGVYPYTSGGLADTYFPGVMSYGQIVIAEAPPVAVPDVQTNVPPTAYAGPDKTVIVHEPVLFDASGSVDPDGAIASYEWQFGDGSTAKGMYVSYVYTQTGDYAAALTVTDNSGATAQHTVLVKVITPAQATQNLLDSLQSYGLPQGTVTSMGSKLKQVLESLSRGNVRAARGQFCAFMREVRALSGKKLTKEQAKELLGTAKKIGILVMPKLLI